MVPDNSYGKYTVQQSLYAFVLKKRYGITVKTARLIHIPADEIEPIAREVVLTLLDDTVVANLMTAYVQLQM